MLALPKLKNASKPSGNRPGPTIPQAPPPPSAHQDVYPCPFCDEHFPHSNKVAEHLQKAHHSDAPYQCRECPTAFAQPLGLSQHGRNKHYKPLAPLQKCSVGGCTFSHKAADVHARHRQHDHVVGTGHPISACPKCKNYKNESVIGVSMHMLHWHSEEHDCEKCDTVFKEPAEKSGHTEQACQAQQRLNKYDPDTEAPLPDHAFPNGWTMADFNPAINYRSAVARGASQYRLIPASIPNSLLFRADPRWLCHENLLRLAEKYTNHELRERINVGRPSAVITGSNVIGTRIATALKVRWNNARAQRHDASTSLGEFKEAFKELREQRQAKMLRRARSRKRAREGDDKDDEQYRASPAGKGPRLEAEQTPDDADSPNDDPMPVGHSAASEALLQQQEETLNLLTPEEQKALWTMSNRTKGKKAANRVLRSLNGAPTTPPKASEGEETAASAANGEVSAESGAAPPAGKKGAKCRKTKKSTAQTEQAQSMTDGNNAA